MEGTTLKTCLSNPNKPPAKRADTFASKEKLITLKDRDQMQENYSSRQNSTDLMTAGQKTSLALTEVDSNRRYFQPEPHWELACGHGNHANNFDLAPNLIPVHCITPFCSDALVSPPNLFPPCSKPFLGALASYEYNLFS